jgi:hypothetical protein
MIMNDERLADFIRRLRGLSCQNLCALVSFMLSNSSGANSCSAHFTLEVSRPYLGLVLLIDYCSVPEIKAVSNFFFVQERRSRNF